MTSYVARECDQDPTVVADLTAMYRECPEDVAPIVVVERTILDGHHRALAAAAAGVTPQVSPLTPRQYAAARAAGYDDMEIAGAAHLLAGHDEAMYALAAQFPGARLADRAWEAHDVILSAEA